MIDFIKDAATRAAMESQDGDWMNNPFRHFRGVVVEKIFSCASVETVIPVNVSFKPELVIPLMVTPTAANLTIFPDKFSVGNITIGVAVPGRVILLVGRFDTQVTGKGVKAYGG
jgi:hypothetical protein